MHVIVAFVRTPGKGDDLVLDGRGPFLRRARIKNLLISSMIDHPLGI